MTSDASTSSGKHSTSNIAWGRSKWNTKYPVFWLAQMTLCVVLFYNFPPFVWLNVIWVGLTDCLSILQLVVRFYLISIHVFLCCSTSSTSQPCSPSAVWYSWGLLTTCSPSSGATSSGCPPWPHFRYSWSTSSTLTLPSSLCPSLSAWSLDLIWTLVIYSSFWNTSLANHVIKLEINLNVI